VQITNTSKAQSPTVTTHSVSWHKSAAEKNAAMPPDSLPISPSSSHSCMYWNVLCEVVAGFFSLSLSLHRQLCQRLQKWQLRPEDFGWLRLTSWIRALSPHRSATACRWTVCSAIWSSGKINTERRKAAREPRGVSNILFTRFFVEKSMRLD